MLILLFHCCLSAKVRILSIGVSDYPTYSGWNNINAQNDVLLISSLSKDSKTLENERATYAGINQALKSLYSQAAPGDTVIVHFSGHGQQIISLNPENEVDGIDEALVPFDALKTETKGYKGQYHFRDDEFGEKIMDLREKTGEKGLVIAIIDACHSDSMDRDADEVSQSNYRGTDEIFGLSKQTEEFKQEIRRKYYDTEPGFNLNYPNITNMSPVVFISACATHQRNYEIEKEGKKYGSLSYYFYKVASQRGFKNFTSFLDALYKEMTNDEVLKFHGQKPVIRSSSYWKEPEGNNLSHEYNCVKVECVDQPNSIIFTIFIIIAGLLGIIIAIIFIIRKWRKKIN